MHTGDFKLFRGMLAYLLKKTHLQIQFILEESGFLLLQNKGFKLKLHYNDKIYQVVFQPCASIHHW
jgi:hypothetical protein